MDLKWSNGSAQLLQTYWDLHAVEPKGEVSVVWLEPREVAQFELDDLLAGGTGMD